MKENFHIYLPTNGDGFDSLSTKSAPELSAGFSCRPDNRAVKKLSPAELSVPAVVINTSWSVGEGRGVN